MITFAVRPIQNTPKKSLRRAKKEFTNLCQDSVRPKYIYSQLADRKYDFLLVAVDPLAEPKLQGFITGK